MASLAGSSDEGFTYLLQKYEAWQRYTASLAHDNEMLRHRAVRAEEALGPLQTTESQARQDVTKIRTALHGLQNQHSAYLQAEVANANLNNMVRALQEELQKANKELQKEKSENERRMADAEDTHTRALTAARAEAEKHVDMERENGKMQLVQLKAQLEASHRERHEEIMRIRLEYESRLTRIQANGLASRRGVGTPGPDVAIYRQKLQALEERRKREVMNLQQRLALLEGGRGRGGRSTEGAAVLRGVTNTNQNWKWKM